MVAVMAAVEPVAMTTTGDSYCWASAAHGRNARKARSLIKRIAAPLGGRQFLRKPRPEQRTGSIDSLNWLPWVAETQERHLHPCQPRRTGCGFLACFATGIATACCARR